MERPLDVRGTSAKPEQKEHRGTKRKQLHLPHDSRQGSRGLRRPKRPLSFQISAVQEDHPHRVPSTEFSVSTTVDALEKRVLLINLIIRRNKNQHRNQSFFKHLCLLRTSLVRLLGISARLFEVSRLAVSVKSSEQVRRNFEVEASLRSQKDVLEEHIREVLVPRCYVTFSGLVGDSQFGNLGVVLVALLSEIACGRDGVGSMRVIQGDDAAVLGRSNQRKKEEKDIPSDWFGPLLGTSTRVTGEDQGEIVERMYDRGVVEGEYGTDSGSNEGSHWVESGYDDDDHPPRGKIPQEDVSGTQLQGQSERVEAEPLPEVKQTSRKVSKEGGIEKGTTRKTKKTKKSKNAIDDLFSSLL